MNQERRELELFLESAFGRGDPATGCAFAPGRVNLIGEHVDYNQGPVLPVALDRGSFVSVRRRDDRRARLASLGFDQRVDVDLDRRESPAGWAAYPLAMVRALEDAGHAVGGFDLAVSGNLPIGAGLSSSASLLVACARALDQLFCLGLSPSQQAEAAFAAETRYVGVACGIMDPMACSLARKDQALFFDCRDGAFEHLPLDPEALRVVVIDSGTRRELIASRYNQRVGECQQALAAIQAGRPGILSLRDVDRETLESARSRMSDVVHARALHVVEEIERVFDFRQALLRRDYRRCGELLGASHRSLSGLFEASTELLDDLVARVSARPGVFGARLTGAGWGGCVVALVEPGGEIALESWLRLEYEGGNRFRIIH